MPWVCLVLAGVLEIVWARGLPKTDGFTKLGPSLFVGAAMVASFRLLAVATRTIPIGTAYAIWVAIGAAGTTIVGALFFGESLPPIRIVCIAMMIAGVIGLKITA